MFKDGEYSNNKHKKSWCLGVGFHRRRCGRCEWATTTIN